MNKLLLLPLLLLAAMAPVSAKPEFPQRPVRFAEMEAMLRELDAAHDHIQVTVEGQSAGGRPLYLVRLAAADVTPTSDPWRVFAIGAQHGNEQSGKDALLVIIDEVAADPGLLPPNTELYFLPMANPEGVDGDQRRNANEADLNRDHRGLLQPETATIHRIHQRLRAHVTIDCHEYTRDSSSWTSAGMKKWPLVTLGVVNCPYVDGEVIALAEERLAEAQRAFDNEDGYVPFMEYLVGGPPPLEELRPSTPEADDARNGLGVYGNLSFIIEAGIFRGNPDPQADFVARTEAYRQLLWLLIRGGDRDRERAAIQRARTAPPPSWLPTNYFWASTQPARIFEYPALDVHTLEKFLIPTANFMDDLAIKEYVRTPVAYAITPDPEGIYRTLLERHGIPFEVLENPREAVVEQATLLRVEEDYDAMYARYDGRQIVELSEPGPKALPPGTLYIHVAGLDGVRAALLLEPKRVYGLYEFAPFRATVGEDGAIPVHRVMEMPR